jgi:cell division protein FtsQ
MSLFTRNGPTVEPDDGSPDEEKTVRLVRKRFARRQWARRWLAWRRVLVVGLVLALLVAAGWLVFFSSVLSVAGVQVVGTSQVLTPASVRRAAEVPMGAPLATADLDGVRARVERLPAVRSVDVSRAWPDRIRIDVTERRAVAVVQGDAGGGRLRGTDPEGVLFRQYATRPRDLPMIRMGSRTGSEALAEAAAVAGSLPPALARKVGYVEVRTVDTISLALRSGRTVRWGSADESAAKAKVLSALLGQKAAFYDVSVPGQPIIRR